MQALLVAGVVGHAVVVLRAFFHPIEDLVATLRLVDRPAEEFLGSAHHVSVLQAVLAVGDDGEAEDALELEPVHGLLLKLRPVRSLLAVIRLVRRLQGPRGAVPNDPRLANVGGVFGLVLAEGATFADDDAALDPVRDDPALLGRLPVEEALRAVGGQPTVPVPHEPVHRDTERVRELEIDAVEDLVVTSAACDLDFLFRHRQVRGLPQNGDGLQLVRGPGAHRAHAAEGVLRRQGGHRPSLQAGGQGPRLLGVDAVGPRLRPRALGRRLDEGLRGRRIPDGGAPAPADKGDAGARVVGGGRRAVVREGHLARALREDDVLMDALLVLHNADAVHLVILPVPQGLALVALRERPVLPAPIELDPDAQAVAVAILELTQIGAAALLEGGEVLDAVPMRQVLLPLAVVHDSCQLLLLVLAVVDVFVDELPELELLEVLRPDGPLPRVRHPIVREGLALLEALDELLFEILVGHLLDVQGAPT
mmetsp:Transcript_111176/g.319458  ORF Transcript_111176/g.319458 Transcript_111176/m.319458 type:complete len:480 (+) Transcript_111176:521-1960(+)